MHYWAELLLDWRWRGGAEWSAGGGGGRPWSRLSSPAAAGQHKPPAAVLRSIGRPARQTLPWHCRPKGLPASRAGQCAWSGRLEPTPTQGHRPPAPPTSPLSAPPEGRLTAHGRTRTTAATASAAARFLWWRVCDNSGVRFKHRPTTRMFVGGRGVILILPSRGTVKQNLAQNSSLPLDNVFWAYLNL